MQQKIIKISRSFYAVALIVNGIQQFVFADFRNVFFPAWQSKLVLLPLWAGAFGLILIFGGAAIIFEKKGREAAFILGGLFLVSVGVLHIPYELILEPHSSWHLGLWGDALKELALSGGAFIISRTFSENPIREKRKLTSLYIQEEIYSLGEIFFSLTIICFGIAHFLYAEPLSTLVPVWIPDHLSWTYFAGVALLSSGVAIILDIRRKLIAGLLGIMIMSWFILLHIPRVIADPYTGRSHEIAEAFDALAFSGIATAGTDETKITEIQHWFWYFY